MNKELAAYMKIEGSVSGAFNFFINGMVAALIYHKADSVAVDALSLAIDLLSTCMGICILTSLFSRASLKRTKTTGILTGGSSLARFLGRLFRHSVLFGVFFGVVTATAVFALTVSSLTLLGITGIPFGVYIALKCVFCALLGGGITALELYSGMNKS